MKISWSKWSAKVQLVRSSYRIFRRLISVLRYLAEALCWPTVASWVTRLAFNWTAIFSIATNRTTSLPTAECEISARRKTNDAFSLIIDEKQRGRQRGGQLTCMLMYMFNYLHEKLNWNKLSNQENKDFPVCRWGCCHWEALWWRLASLKQVNCTLHPHNVTQISFLVKLYLVQFLSHCLARTWRCGRLRWCGWAEVRHLDATDVLNRRDDVEYPVAGWFVGL